MRWATYRSDPEGPDRVGLVCGDVIHGLPGETSLMDLLGDEGLQAAARRALDDPADVVPLDVVHLRPPVPEPPSFRDFMAFEQHVVTSHSAIGLAVDPGWYERPAFYFSNPGSIRGAYDDIAIPPGSAKLDYELEVAAVIGREGADVSPEEASHHIAGFVLLCDWSARDLQAEEMRLHLGPIKGKDFATSLGPWMVTADELVGADVAMSASVNGQRWSSGNLEELYWSFGEMVAYASRGTRVRPGDLIGSGTVGTGCILELSAVHGSQAYPYLSVGDRVQLEADMLGAIDATIVAGRAPIPLRVGSSREDAR